MTLWGSNENHHNERTDLCFPIDEINNNAVNFNVDHFVAAYKREFGFERLTNDLVSYLNKLVSDMLRLIDSDYAEFVYLCQKVVVIDKPVYDAAEESVKVSQELRSTCEEIASHKKKLDTFLLKKAELRNDQQRLQFLITAYEAVENLKEQLNDEENIDRTVISFISLANLPIADEDLNNEIECIRKQLIRLFQKSFIRNIENKDINSMVNLTKTLNSIDLFQDVCCEVRTNAIIPAFKNIFNAHCMNKTELSVMYSKLLDLINDRFAILRECDKQTRNMHTSCLKNLIWPSLKTCIDTLTETININNGNADLFYQSYMRTQNFVEQFEAWCENLLSLSGDSKAFFSRWNTKMYFNNKMKELSSTLERALLSPAKRNESDETPRLMLTKFLVQCCEACWSEGMYAPGLDAVFSKVFLKLLSRYNDWLKDILESDHNPDNLLLHIYSDLFYIKSSLSEQVKTRSVFPFVQKRLNGLLDNQPLLVNKYLKWLVDDESISKIQDIPRLYLRTNRASPLNYSNYVDETLSRVTSNYELIQKSLSESDTKKLIDAAFTHLASTFYGKAFEMLESVRKVDESLKKIRRSRPDRSASVINSVSDFEKIHQQIMLDVCRFKEICLKYSDSSELIEILNKLGSLK